jgi:hypothetical protein
MKLAAGKSDEPTSPDAMRTRKTPLSGLKLGISRTFEFLKNI